MHLLPTRGMCRPFHRNDRHMHIKDIQYSSINIDSLQDVWGLHISRIYTCWQVLPFSNTKKCYSCCCCCLPSETYGRNGATPIFRSFFTELPVPPQADGVVGTFNVLDIYPSEHYGLSFFGPYGCLFLQGLLFFVYISILQVHFACVLCI